MAICAVSCYSRERLFTASSKHAWQTQKKSSPRARKFQYWSSQARHWRKFTICGIHENSLCLCPGESAALIATFRLVWNSPWSLWLTSLFRRDLPIYGFHEIMLSRYPADPWSYYHGRHLMACVKIYLAPGVQAHLRLTWRLSNSEILRDQAVGANDIFAAHTNFGMTNSAEGVKAPLPSLRLACLKIF